MVLPAELRELDAIKPGQEFAIERIDRGEYRLVRIEPRNEGLVNWLLSCPDKGYFVPIESESIDSLYQIGLTSVAPRPHEVQLLGDVAGEHPQQITARFGRIVLSNIPGSAADRSRPPHGREVHAFVLVLKSERSVLMRCRKPVTFDHDLPDRELEFLNCSRRWAADCVVRPLLCRRPCVFLL